MQAFVAYPAVPAGIGDAIEAAAQALRENHNHSGLGRVDVAGHYCTTVSG
jgi:hypothetical protein